MRPTDALAGSLVEELVHQFTDPFAFYRELIQNSIDAGSSRIEVTLEFRPAPAAGLALITVADWGEGMNRHVIENYLVTKFRSTKEHDLTKIGKFGIGFVSLFAIRPDAVTVETGRDGEAWRVLFHPDTTWELLKLPGPIEGTRIVLHKTMQASDWAEFVTRSRDAIARWCRYSEVDVVFAASGADGSPLPAPAPLKEPLTVDAPYQVEHREEGTHIVAGPARRAPPLTGFYNRGLTLLESNEPFIEGVTVKIVSRYLEHTLTRDNVRRDKHFAQAKKLAEALVEGKLLAQLPAELEAAAARRDGAADWEVLFRYAAPRLKPGQLRYRLCGGGSATRDEVAAAVRRGALPVSPARNAVVDRLLASAMPVLELTPGAPFTDLVLGTLKLTDVVLAEEHFTYAPAPERLTPPEFAAALLGLLNGRGARFERVELSEVVGAAQGEPFVLLEGVGRPVTREMALGSPFERGAPRVLCLNAAHPAVGAAAPLFARAPRLGAVLMARLVLVHHGRLDHQADWALTAWGLS
jgi:molecular chaperone HtpG